MAFRNTRGRFAKNPHTAGIMADGLTRGIALYEVEVVARIKRVMYEFSKEMLAYAQDNAPWNDRTGEARMGLDAALEDNRTELKIWLYHTASYGLWLEIRWNGLYAIILPTIEDLGPELMRRIEAVI